VTERCLDDFAVGPVGEYGAWFSRGRGLKGECRNWFPMRSLRA